MGAEAYVLSKIGTILRRLKPFDEGANGFVMGESRDVRPHARGRRAHAEQPFTLSFAELVLPAMDERHHRT